MELRVVHRVCICAYVWWYIYYSGDVYQVYYVSVRNTGIRGGRGRRAMHVSEYVQGPANGTHAPDRKIYMSVISIYQVYNTSSVE